jgi:hypothetical protein
MPNRSTAGAPERVDGHPRHDEQRDDDDDHADDRDRPNARRDEQTPMAIAQDCQGGIGRRLIPEV